MATPDPIFNPRLDDGARQAVAASRAALIPGEKILRPGKPQPSVIDELDQSRHPVRELAPVGRMPIGNVEIRFRRLNPVLRDFC